MRNFEGGNGMGVNPANDPIERDRQALRAAQEAAGVLGGASRPRGEAQVAEWVNDSLAGAGAEDTPLKAFEMGEGDIKVATARLAAIKTEIQQLTEETNRILDRRSKVVDATMQSQMRDLAAQRMKKIDDLNYEEKQLEIKLTNAAKGPAN